MVFLSTQMLFSQQSEIVKILNEALKQDLKIEVKNHHFSDTIKIIKPYSIIKNILSVELKYRKGGEYHNEMIQVPLSKIKSVSKDSNVIFETFDEEDVKIIQAHPASAKQLGYFRYLSSGIFFTGIRNQRKNKFLGEALQKAFAKAGYKIELGSWYD